MKLILDTLKMYEREDCKPVSTQIEPEITLQKKERR